MARLHWRWIPCEDYDLEGTESWLQAMAGKGLFLQKVFFGFAGFVKDAPKLTRYRLSATRGSVLDEDWATPDSEEAELSAAAGWYYVCPRGRFFLYACDDLQAPELHTDPAVQALQLKHIRRDAYSSLFAEIYFCLLHPLLWLHDDLFRMIAALPWLALDFALVAGTGLVLAVLRAVYLWGLTCRLRRGRAPVRDERHRRRGLRLRCLQMAEIAAILMLFAAAFFHWGEAKPLPLPGYAVSLPFATLQDLAGGGEVEWAQDAYARNEVTVSHTLTAPAVYDFVQDATVRQNGRAVLNGTLFVDYYETRWEWLARGVARDLRAGWLRAKDAEPLALEGIDEAWWTNGPYGQVLLRRGCRVMSLVYFTASDRDLPLVQALPVFVERFLA